MLTKSSLLYQKFIANIKWNALSAIYYQTVLTLFMVWLFKVTSLATYGLIGTVFAVLYLLVDLLDLGFDGALAIDFKALCASKLKFRQIFLTQQLTQLVLLTLVSLGLILGHDTVNNWLVTQFSCCAISPLVWLILGLLLICEGLLKDLRALAQLFFLSRVLALTQFLGITIYTGIIWLSYYFGLVETNLVSAQLNLIFGPLLISSVINLVILSWALHQKYLTLPEPESTQNSVLQKKRPVPIQNQTHKNNGLDTNTVNIKILAKQRFWVFLNQISKLVFSSNFLITLLASLFGAAAVAPLKLTSRITVYLRYVLYHSLGLPIRALLSHTQARLTFRHYRQVLKHAFYALAGILVGAGLVLISLTITHTDSLAVLIRENSLLFLGILLLDSLFLAHEQYLLVANQIYYLALPNLLTIGLIYGLASNYHPSLNSCLLSLAALRLGTFVLINLVVLKKFVEKTPRSL